ncbi:MAG: transcription-repair coupling factor [Gammaproteobacteria bacterium]|nr:transcription-repair coupling factor [Gammaproteobacteria bacterium]
MLDFVTGALSTRFWGQLYGSARGLAIAQTARQRRGLVLVVTASTREALTLEREIRFYLAGESLPVLSMPDWETLPYDKFSPHQDIVAERLSTLYRLPNTAGGVLITPVSTCLQRLSPPSYLHRHVLLLAAGDRLDPAAFRERLVQSGYRHASQVMEHGEFAVRGNLIDLFPPGSPVPYRIDLFDDEIETLRTFDSNDQRTLETVDRIELLPAREYPLHAAAITRFRQAFRDIFESGSRQSPIYRDVSNGLAPAGLEYYLPLFFDEVATLFDYLPTGVQCFVGGAVPEAMDVFWQQVEERYEDRRHDLQHPLLPPQALFLPPPQALAALDGLAAIELRSTEQLPGASAISNFGTQQPPRFPINARVEHPLAELQQFIDGHDYRVLFVAESRGRREALFDLLHGNDIRPEPVDDWAAFVAGDQRLAITVDLIEHGCLLPEAKLAVVTEQQIFGDRVRQSRRRRQATRDAQAVIANLTDLHQGAPVVHIDHGIGRYAGMTTLTIADVETEFLTLRYADNDKLYVPVASLHLVSRYTGTDSDNAPLHKLGGEQWQKIKSRAARKARDVAAELLDIHARRAARSGRSLTADTADLQAFAAGFPFEETPDQAQAIDATIDDLSASRTMDRVVCGDVGFGKTEVAMRAAFVAVEANTQVALLVPTTLLAQQHYQNFRDRFADWPVRIEALSRFQGNKRHQEIVAALAEGKVDIVIGTHKLLQKSIAFKSLGLVIVDEEHRFGVRHKEQLKALRAEVDLLTLTATPIPRTLNMSLAGLRDLSIIATPPAHRHAIKTFVSEWSDVLVREALQRELARGGQIYVVHNEVKSIERVARQITEVVPEATVRIAHGQLPERELEQVMLDFYHQRFNVLACTTIIESGIDVPSANTIIINRADKLGMAQLHQLRGRVGRSHHRAYAYLFAPPANLLTADAQKRLEAVESLEDLGMGFTLATHDMEIRGAGELLGEEQSGQIQEVGFTLYTELLERAVRALKAGEMNAEIPLTDTCEVDMRLAALIPDSYVPDVHARLILYKRIANCADAAALREMQVELIDRFGLLPDATRNLMRVTEIKIRALESGIVKIEANPAGGRIVFASQPKVNPSNVVALVQSQSETYAFGGADSLRFKSDLGDEQARFEFVEALLDTLQADSTDIQGIAL